LATFTILKATDGRELIKLALKHKPALIVTDSHMPGLNGMDALDQIRRANPEQIAILISGTPEDVESFNGVAFCKNKLSVRDVLAAIQDALR